MQLSCSCVILTKCNHITQLQLCGVIMFLSIINSNLINGAKGAELKINPWNNQISLYLQVSQPSLIFM